MTYWKFLIYLLTKSLIFEQLSHPSLDLNSVWSFEVTTLKWTSMFWKNIRNVTFLKPETELENVILYYYRWIEVLTTMKNILEWSLRVENWPRYSWLKNLVGEIFDFLKTWITQPSLVRIEFGLKFWNHNTKMNKFVQKKRTKCHFF